ncbi:hypothetical protein AGMMS50256_21980 [Betaproteobacteria bacterium]|nr:hypothetical protein AGMMS50256_21980 [Betaproteobacteria bacterium]
MVTVTDEKDRVVVEKRVPNELEKILGLLIPWRDELAGVVVESTYNGYWLVDGLQVAGFQVPLANTVAIKQYEGLKHSGDEADAHYLAHLLRLGNGSCEIWPGSACNWYAAAPRTFLRSKTSWPANRDTGWTVTRSNA